MKIVREESVLDDEHERRYHVNIELCQQEVEMLIRGENDESVSALAHLIIEIPGVESVELRPYTIKITKGQAFDWKSVEHHVYGLLRFIGSVDRSSKAGMQHEIA